MAVNKASSEPLNELEMECIYAILYYCSGILSHRMCNDFYIPDTDAGRKLCIEYEKWNSNLSPYESIPKGDGKKIIHSDFAIAAFLSSRIKSITKGKSEWL